MPSRMSAGDEIAVVEGYRTTLRDCLATLDPAAVLRLRGELQVLSRCPGRALVPRDGLPRPREPRLDPGGPRRDRRTVRQVRRPGGRLGHAARPPLPAVRAPRHHPLRRAPRGSARARLIPFGKLLYNALSYYDRGTGCRSTSTYSKKETPRCGTCSAARVPGSPR